ncbi:MAG: DUF3473 domain-containing protein [Candidatus Abyssobacteria bacterium SURF_5]|uniref:DUF3473 domain-containing protein n=1 Tax=Abyssobacteria bacterium (strain SURF_5) TaxID=2093360 RepID=A0A3A4NIV8_ABYX5|nr:MAG: DUF3473 domain-containing protein [Candidatus Abyssubacteria bacterium SURF_5]
MRNALTIDVEDYFQVESFKSLVKFESWEQFALRVEANVDRLLAILEEEQIRCTFFVLGWIADRAPQVVRRIHGQGHEVASHGYAHQMVTGQTPGEFRDDIHKAKSILEDITGEGILGYRAPTFSVTRNTFWALDALVEEGFLYDSSVFPVRHDRYGIPDWTQYITRVQLRNGASILEVPPLTAKVLGTNIPLGGGGYFRLAPLWLSRWAILRFNSVGHPAVIYLHPWEIDASQPRFPLPPLQRFRHYVNIETTERKLRRLLAGARFTSVRNVLSL